MTHPLTWISTWLHGLVARRPDAENHASATVAPRRLHKILVVVSRCRGAVHDDQLLVDQLSPDCMLFYTRADVGEGDDLELRLLIPGRGPVRFDGKVAWLRPSKGGLQGELVLQNSPAQREFLVDFLERDARRHR